MGIRLGYRPTGLLATYSIAPNTHHPRLGITSPQDITDIAVPFNSRADDGLEWTLPLDREFYTPFGKVTIEGESGPLQHHVPRFRIHPL